MEANAPYKGPYSQLTSQLDTRRCLNVTGPDNISYRIAMNLLVGHGKFGYVYPVKRLDLPSSVFVAKIVDTRLVARELIQAVADLHTALTKSGPCEEIVQLYSHFYHQDTWAISVLEYMPGGTLDAYITKVGQLPPPKIVAFTKNLLNGLVFLHDRNYAHRDLTLTNLLLNGEQSQLKIADFGLATWHTHTSESGQTHLSRTRCGSLLYMAPEICLAHMPGPYQYDAQKVDIWSVGIVLFYMLHRRFPWTFPQEAARLEARFWPAIFYEVLTSGHATYDYPRIGRWGLELNLGILIKNPERRPTARRLADNKYLNGEIPESWGPSRAPSSASG